MIKKIKNQLDKRKLEVVLTDQGEEEIAQAPDSVQVQFMKNFLELPEWEQHQIAAVLGKITSLMHAENLQAAPILQVGPLA